MREILFRGKDAISKEWVYGDLIHGVGHKNGNVYILPIRQILASVKNCDPLDGVKVIPETVGQLVGGFSVGGHRVFEGDIIRTRSLIPTYQTHYGDNIPNGSYTEPIGHDIIEEIGVMEFQEGSFGIQLEGSGEPSQADQHDRFIYFLWIETECTEDELIRACDQKKNRDLFDNDWTEEKEYLALIMEEHKIPDTAALLEYMKPAIVGNIHDEKPTSQP